jgi:(S)-citramalyl-CoA lyase
MKQNFTARSLLFTPATRPDRYAKAVLSGADIVTIDLEDAVSLSDKDAARKQALSWFSNATRGQEFRALRINSMRTEHGFRDVLAIVEENPKVDLVIIPKAESAAELQQLDELLRPLEETRFMAIIESAKGLSNVDSIIRSTSRLVALLFGAADLSADLRLVNSWEGLLYARSHVVRAAAEGAIEVLDSPCFDLTGTSKLTEELEGAARLGFTGKAAIHPKHIPVINTAFTPSSAEVEEAEKIVLVAGQGVGTVNGQMVDEAMARRARRVLALARRHI